MPNEYPVWHTRYIVDVDAESRNDGDWLNLGLVDCNITNGVMQIKRLINYRVCKFYWWVESVWLLLHKFWSHFGIFGVKYHYEQSHFSDFPARGPGMYTLWRGILMMGVAPCLLPKISGVDMTPSVTSVESSEQFWRKIRQIWCICEPRINSRNNTSSQTQ